MHFVFLFFLVNICHAFEDPTGGKAFGPWLYHDQLKPMVKEAGEANHLSLLGGAVVGSVLAKPYDRKVRDHHFDHGNLFLGREESVDVSQISDGWLQVGVSLVTLGLDTEEGVKLSRALIFSSVSTGLLKFVVHRERPDKSNSASWPSGHTSSMFAMAGSLSGSYGLWAALPAYSAAVLVASSRINENQHWLSDVVGGAFIGTYWALVTHGTKERNYSFAPVPVDNGLLLVFTQSY